MPQSSPESLGADVDFTSWHWWWEFNKEPFLELKDHLYEGGVASGTEGFFLGQGYRDQGDVPDPRRKPSSTQIREIVLPALVKTLATANSNDVVTACLIALAKVGEDQSNSSGVELASVIRPYLKDSNQEIAETAAAALGILGNEASALTLSELLLDTPAGQRAVDSGRVSLRTRSFAAYGLGLLGAQSDNVDVRRYIVHKLTRALLEDDSATQDLGVACVLSLGLVPLPWSGDVSDSENPRVLPATASREAQIRVLLDVYDERDTDRLVRAHIVNTLGALVGQDRPRAEDDLPLRTSFRHWKDKVADTLFDALRGKGRATAEVAQSAALALGRLGDSDNDPVDEKIRATLTKVDTLSSDALTRNFASIALAYVGSRPGEGAAIGAPDVRTELLRRLSRGGNSTERWAAIALGVFERRMAAGGHVPPNTTLSALRRSLADARSPRDVGAFAIGCGITRDPAAEEALLDRLKKIDDDQARGYLALGLGLIDTPGSLPAVRRLVDGATYRPRLLREAATALGLLGDRDAVGILIERLAKAGSLATQASLAQALGRIGDASAIDPLVEMIGDRRLTQNARAFAVIALGIVSDKDRLPWNATLSAGVNYAQAPPTLYDQNGFGILNIL